MSGTGDGRTNQIAGQLPPPGSSRPAPPPPRPVLLRPPLPPPRLMPAALPLPPFPRSVYSVVRPILPPPEPSPLFTQQPRPTFEELLAARVGPRVRRRSPLIGAVVDAIGIQVIILTITMVMFTIN